MTIVQNVDMIKLNFQNTSHKRMKKVFDHYHHYHHIFTFHSIRCGEAVGDDCVNPSGKASPNREVPV